MGYKHDKTMQNDDWDRQKTNIYLEYAKRALENGNLEEYWRDTDIREKSDSFAEFEEHVEDADDLDLWMSIYW